MHTYSSCSLKFCLSCLQNDIQVGYPVRIQEDRSILGHLSAAFWYVFGAKQTDVQPFEMKSEKGVHSVKQIHNRKLERIYAINNN